MTLSANNRQTDLARSTLRAQATRGGGLSAIGVAVEKCLAILQTAVVARLLQPADFGIFALGFAFLLAASNFTSLGIEKHLIQRTKLPQELVRTAWLANIMRNVVVALVMFASASVYSNWVNEPVVAPVLRVLSLAPLLISLGSPNQFLAQREMQFRRLATFQVVAGVLQFIVFVILASVLQDVYALAVGQVTMAGAKTVLTWIWFGIPGTPLFKRTYIKEIIQVGQHFFIIAAGTFVMTQADNLIVGALLGATVLGYYALAYKVTQFAVDLLNAVVGRVVFPVFSQLQNESGRLSSAFKEIWSLQIALLVPMAAAIAVLADDAVLLLLGPRYADASPLLRVLAILTFSRGISHILAPFIIGTGGIRFASRIKFFEAGLFVLAVWLATVNYGVTGAAWAAGAVYTLSALARLYYAIQRLRLTTGWILRSVGGASLAAGIAAVPAALVDGAGIPVLDLFLALGLFAAFYVGTSLICQRPLVPIVRKTVAALRL